MPLTAFAGFILCQWGFLMLHGCEEHHNMQHSNYSFSVDKIGHGFAGQEFVWAMTEN